MTYIIAEPCIDVHDQSCIKVCPVDCIHVAARMLVVDPVVCIDCGACESECPVSAIYPGDALPPNWSEFAAINAAVATGGGIPEVDALVEDYTVRHDITPPD